jgi:hypothetical protein
MLTARQFHPFRFTEVRVTRSTTGGLMNRSRIGRVVRVAIPAVLLVVVSNVVACAQGNNPFDQVLAKLDEIIGTLVPPAGAVKLSTSPALVSDDQNVICGIANIGTEDVAGLVRVFGPNGAVVIETPISAEPGRTTSRFAPGPGFFRCEFTFQGTATSVRANLQVTDLASQDVTAIVDAR